jgi:hypothetical protein
VLLLHEYEELLRERKVRPPVDVDVCMCVCVYVCMYVCLPVCLRALPQVSLCVGLFSPLYADATVRLCVCVCVWGGGGGGGAL